MIRISGHSYVKPALVISCILLMSGGCSTPVHEGFAIYLTRGDVPPAQMAALSHVDLTGQPVIAMNDIVAYDEITHEITLTAQAFDTVSNLDVPVGGRSFMVCVDRKPVYWGAFWTPVSSISFDGITIWKPLGSQDTRTIKLELGYPSPAFYGGEDPRHNPEVLESLRQSGKLAGTPR